MITAHELENYGLGRGLYTPAEAARIGRVPVNTLRRWFQGYSFLQRSGEKGRSRAVLSLDYPRSPDGMVLSFANLMEMRIIDRLRRLNVSWPELRRAAEVASQILSTPHPFITLRFRTDGQRIFAQIVDQIGNKQLIELSRRQHVFAAVIEPYLKGLEFSGDDLLRWWPLGDPGSAIVVDPSRCFGRPVVNACGVPSAILAGMARTSSLEETADWYEVDVQDVRAALDYEIGFLQ